jgi:hypothetical protein
MGNSTVLTQDIPLSSGEPVRADAVLQDSAPVCCGKTMSLQNTKRNGEYKRYACKFCDEKISFGSKGRGRPRKESAPKI